MKQIGWKLFFGALIAAAPLFAQDSQAIVGSCGNSTVNVGSSGNSGGSCSLIVLAGAHQGTTVPSGKLLIIEDISVLCTKSGNDTITLVSIGGDGNGQPSYQKDVPLTLRAIHGNGNQTWRGSVSTRSYLPPNEPIRMKVTLGAAATAMVTCQGSFSGQLVSYP